MARSTVRPGPICSPHAEDLAGATPAMRKSPAVTALSHHGADGEPELLARCYRRSLELAVAHRLTSIAFPAISCGAYGYPLHLAVPIAVHAVRNFDALDALDRVVFACVSPEVHHAYEAALGASH